MASTQFGSPKSAAQIEVETMEFRRRWWAALRLSTKRFIRQWRKSGLAGLEK